MPSEQNIERLIQESARAIAQSLPQWADRARTEADLRQRCNELFNKFIEKAGLLVEGRLEYFIKGGRADSKYGAVIIEYKNPRGPQRITIRPRNGRPQHVVVQLLERFQALHEVERIPLSRLFGVGCDGKRLIFVTYGADRFEISEPQNVSRYSIERLLRALVSLGAEGRSFL